MPFPKRNSGMELGAVVKVIARMTFIMSTTFFVLAVMLLFLFSPGLGEQVILLGTVFMTSCTSIGSLFLMRKMYKSDAEIRRKKELEAKEAGNFTMDEWLKKTR